MSADLDAFEPIRGSARPGVQRRRPADLEAFLAFARLLGDLHEESYVYVQDVRAAAYGYGGKTQEFRYQRG